MVDHGKINKNEANKGANSDNNKGDGMSCHNSLRWLAHIGIPRRNTR